MGNQASRAGATGPDLADLPDVVLKRSLGGSRFFKTTLCLHDEGGLVVVKSYRRAEDAAADVRRYEDQVVAIRSALASIPDPHIWPTQRVYHTDRSVHLVRQYLGASLAARTTSRPFLTAAEKRWLGYQLLMAVAQAHSAGVHHGDIKSENALITSWGWLMLADFAPYKPTMLPADNPADFSFFFDTSSRRKCYLAPERFFDSTGPAPPATAPLTAAMDVFAAGCVIAELFADGEPLFDYSRLLAFRRGAFDPGSAISTLGPGVAAVVAHMTQLDPTARLPAAAYVQMFSEQVMDPAVPRAVRPFLASVLCLDPSSRAEAVAAGYPALRDELDSHPATPSHVIRGSLPEKIEMKNEIAAEKEEQQRRHSEGEGVGTRSGGAAASQMYAQAAALLVEAKAAVAGLGAEKSAAAGVEVAVEPRSFHCQQQQQQHALEEEDDVVGEVMGGASMRSPLRTFSRAPRSQAAADEAAAAAAAEEERPNDGLVVLLGLLCSVLRGCTHQSTRVRLIGQLCDCAVRCGDDEARQQRAIPQLVAAAAEQQFSAARCAALKALPRVAARVRRVPPGDARAFADYMLPALSRLPTDAEPWVQTQYAAVLATLAVQARSVVERVQRGGSTAAAAAGSGAARGVVHYDEELGRLRVGVERAVHDLLVGAHPGPKLALLAHLAELADVLGRRDSADGLLPALLTLFNCREWEVRRALYSRLGGVCPALGPQGVAFLLPFLDRMLSDPEPAAVAAAAGLLSGLCREDLLRQRHVLAAAGKVAGAGLLRHECTAVRAAVAEFITAAAAALPPVATRALLLPALRPYLAKPPEGLHDVAAVVAALEPRAFRRSGSSNRSLSSVGPGAGGVGGAGASSGASPAGAARSAAGAAGEPGTLEGTHSRTPSGAAGAPSVSYSVVLDRSLLRHGSSRLSAALKQAQLAGNRAGGGKGVPQLVAAAHRNVARSAAVPGVTDLGAAPSMVFTADGGSITAGGDGTAVDGTRRPTTAQQGTADAGDGAQRAVPAPWRPRGVLVAHLPEHKRAVTKLLPVPDTPLFISTSEDGTAKVWDVRRLERDISFRPRASYEGHTKGANAQPCVSAPGGGVRAAAAMAESATIATGDGAGEVHVWRVERAVAAAAPAAGAAAAQQGRWHVGAAPRRLPAAALGGGAVMDLHGWGPDLLVAATAVGGVSGIDLRAPSSSGGGGCAWRLPCPPSRGAITRVCCDPAGTTWLVTGSSRGAMALWDVRFLLPLAQWNHPGSSRIDALALEASPPAFLPRTPAPVVLAAAGRDEVAAWDAGSGKARMVFRIVAPGGSGVPGTAAGGSGGASAQPEALAPPPADVGPARDPLARARQLGATELRTLAPRKPGFRCLLSGPGLQLLSGSSDCAVRYWDCANPERSYVVAAPPPPHQQSSTAATTSAVSPPAVPPSAAWTYSIRVVNGVPVVEQRGPAGGGAAALGVATQDEDRDRVLTAKAEWDRAAGLCHHQTVTDLARVEGHAEALLLSASMDGVVKVWR